VSRPHRGTRRWAVAVMVVATVLAACSAPSGKSLPPPAPAGGAAITYVAVGASETVGFGADEPLREAWPRVFFRTALPPSAVFVNMGIPGATVASATKDELPQALTVNPTLVTVWLNVNDIVAGVPATDYERDLETLVHSLRRDGGTRVLVANSPPLDDLPAYLACRPDPPPGARCRAGSLPSPQVLDGVVDAYNAATARVAAREGALLVDLHGVGLAARQAGTASALVSGDGFHPSTAGHEAVAKAFADVLAASGPLTPPG
jgi:lysophospholipase L1-like esterase